MTPKNAPRPLQSSRGDLNTIRARIAFWRAQRRFLWGKAKKSQWKIALEIALAMPDSFRFKRLFVSSLKHALTANPEEVLATYHEYVTEADAKEKSPYRLWLEMPIIDIQLALTLPKKRLK